MAHFPEEHNQIQVKVNKLVDEGVAPLVIALNEFDGVMTNNSCENSLIHKSPFVSFLYGDFTWQSLNAFIAELKKALDELELCCGYELSVVWPCSVDSYPNGRLLVAREHIAEVAAKLSEVAPIINCRMSQSGGDSQYKEPHNC